MPNTTDSPEFDISEFLNLPADTATTLPVVDGEDDDEPFDFGFDTGAFSSATTQPSSAQETTTAAETLADVGDDVSELSDAPSWMLDDLV